MSSKQQPCRFIRAPDGCRRGAKCNFSHDLNRASVPFEPSNPQHHRSSSYQKPNDKNSHKNGHNGASRSASQFLVQESGTASLEAKLRAWRGLAKLVGKGPKTLGRASLQQFFETAGVLVAADPGVMQVVVKELASDGGLERIRELCSMEASLTGLDVTRSAEMYVGLLLPFLNLITDPNILASAILETHVSDIYLFLYGPGGQRVTKVFNGAISAIEAIEGVAGNMETATNICSGIVVAAIQVVDRLMDISTRVAMNEELHSVATKLRGLYHDHFSNGVGNSSSKVARYLDRIDRRMAIAGRIPDAMPPTTAPHQPSIFEIQRDLPGRLSNDGPRHDNDFENIEEIEILPTTSEIMAVRAEYLPTTEPRDWHLQNVEGLLDRQFRLLREDTVGQLRDAVRNEVEQMQNPGLQPSNAGSKTIRTLTYTNLKFLSMKSDKDVGVVFEATVDQPHRARTKINKELREWWMQSKRLPVDAVVCIIGNDGDTIFCSVTALSANRKNQTDDQIHHLNVQDDPSQVRFHLRLIEHDPDCIKRLVQNLTSDQVDRSRFQTNMMRVVEFPNVLLPSFYPTLKALKTMSAKKDLPFGDILASLDTLENDLHLEPPEYCLKQGFRVDLAPVMKGSHKSLFWQLNNAFDVETLATHSILDETQAQSLIDALSRRLAIIQGPPGTGKSYTGVALIRVLLANKKAGKLGPILCVCYTNHALDQLLEHLLDNKVQQIIRIGSRSKSERLAPINIREVTARMTLTKTEANSKWVLKKQLQSCVALLQSVTRDINEPNHWMSLKSFLEEQYPEHYRQLFGEDEEGFKMVVKDPQDHIRRWLKGSVHPNTVQTDQLRIRNLDDLMKENAWLMTTSERQILHTHWLVSLRESSAEKLEGLLSEFQNLKSELDKVNRELDLRCLNQSNVIGVTTSGLARNLELLRRVQCKVLLCEEAGEVLEAHLLTALLPSIEHAVLIGDHFQLRPQTNNYDLKYENPRGKQYSLDVSLFERLVDPKSATSPRLPFSVLNTQRRMHVSISRLVRETLYPNLEDGNNVKGYPAVNGMKHRLFWFNHTHPEADHGHDDIQTTSHSNEFEVEMTVSLVTHLVRQGVYQPNDIAVITPYLGQLHKLRRRLASSFEIVVNERDEADLSRTGFGAASHEETASPQDAKSAVAKTSLLNQLKVATIDNFQGEEAKIVVVSLVRSNKRNQVGFLRTFNRINVLISRAKHGMYILGNAETASTVDMWQQVIDILRQGGNFGPAFQLNCPRHFDTSLLVSSPEDFEKLAPEGGCRLDCEKRLRCGHTCPSKCHSNLLHDAVYCMEPCVRAKPGCDHSCPFPCGQDCGTQCKVMVQNLDITLACGHNITVLPCYQAQNPELVNCTQKVDRKVPKCGHTVSVTCQVDVTSKNFRCTVECGSFLPCGHGCKRPCHTCREQTANGETKISHPDCKQPCGRSYSVCSHACSKQCHGADPCPPCPSPCEMRCGHSKCPRLCSEPCAPCAKETCLSKCPHSKCDLPCAAPCSWVPCSKRCTEKMRCGHQCPSLCGEICPDRKYCQQCAKKAVKDITVDYIEGKTYGEIDLDDEPCLFPLCGHVITCSSMDGVMSMEEFYDIDATGLVVGIKKASEPFTSEKLKTCPQCRGSLRNIARYGRIVRRTLLDEATKRFITAAHHAYVPLEEKAQEVQDSLAGSSEFLKINPTYQIVLAGNVMDQLLVVWYLTNQSKRYHPILALHQQISLYLESVKVEEMPFMRVWQLVETARRNYSEQEGLQNASNAFDITIPKATFYIQGLSLLLRNLLTILSDFFKQVRQSSSNTSTGTPIELRVDFSLNLQDCLQLTRLAADANDPRHVVEGHLYYAHFCALQCSTLSMPASRAITRDASEHINTARKICASHAGSTKGLPKELDSIERALNGGTFHEVVTTEERRAILAAMAQEFRGTGHWYTCVNGHPFTVGECGMPMELSRCPTCNAAVGGRSHVPAAGVTRATELEEELARMSIS